MEATPLDPKSVAGKDLHLAERGQLLVVGAGPAGLAAAIEAARLGLQVVLADENPIPAETMGDEVPLHFGQRMGGAVRNRTAMMETLVAKDPLLAEAFELGVDLRLGTSVFGLWSNGPSVGWLPGPVAGLADGERSWLLGFERAIVAAGSRDMGLAFPGWQLPGVMGAVAAHRLAERYGALEARRAVVLGSSAEALATAAALSRAGVAIAAIVEQAARPLGREPLLNALAAENTPLLTSHIARRAEGGVEGVTAIVVAPLDAEGRPMSRGETRIACDTIVIGIGAVPVIELLDPLGCGIGFKAERGGHVPLTDGAHRTTLPFVYAVGDCAGIWASKTLDPAVAQAEGRRAARDAARSLGVEAKAQADAAAEPDAAGHDLAAYRLGWVRAAVVEASAEAYVCQCEEVTAREILELRPPRYLGWPGSKRNDTDLRSLLGAGPPNPDQVKRLTRAGMGLCQGRRCREQVAALLALGAGVPLGEVPLASYRAPVRPLPLGLVADPSEAPEMTENWEVWFGIPTQWQPPWEVATETRSGNEPPAAK